MGERLDWGNILRIPIGIPVPTSAVKDQQRKVTYCLNKVGLPVPLVLIHNGRYITNGCVPYLTKQFNITKRYSYITVHRQKTIYVTKQ